MRASSTRASRALLLLTLLSPGCGDPPAKEMGQAQGAIEAAKAVGAERYAADQYKAAVTALERAEAAVAQRDYRLALNFALDSREQAQAAARQAADQKARVRSEAERALALVTTALAQAASRLEAAKAAKLPKARLAEPEAAIAAAQKAVQEAGTALGREDYPAARDALTGVAARVAAASTAIEEAARAAPPRPARRRR